MEPAETFDPAALLHALGPQPGVYQMLDDKGKVLYVGKAANLRKRLPSYFRSSGLSPRTQAMTAKVAAVNVTVTASEAEALVLLRDDKSYPYIYLSGHADFPRLGFHRGPRRDRNGSYFGPFPNGTAVRESLNFLHKAFRLRQCEDSYYRNRSRPCLQYQIGRCLAPCVGAVSAEEYRQAVDHTRLFLEGRSRQVLKSLATEMEQAASRLDYERAALLRDQIRSLRQLQERQSAEQGDAEADVIAIGSEPGLFCVQLVHVRHGKIIGSRSFFPRSGLEGGAREVLGAFIGQLYLTDSGAIIPAEVLVSEMPAQAALIHEALERQSGRRVRLGCRVQGLRAKWLKLAQETARHNLRSRLGSRAHNRRRLEALQQLLDLSAAPQRMECFDISHSGGEATVASCVVFDAAGPLPGEYRRFNISGITPGDDYAAMAQALERRYRRRLEDGTPLPDVVMVDGGRGQLRQAREVLERLGQTAGISLLAVAKGPERRPGLETLHLGTQRQPIKLPPQSPALGLIQQLRDEAHRFAIAGHRRRRGKARLTSSLEAIPGIGPRRRRDLLTFFGGIQAVRRASIEELCKIPGISRRLAGVIHEALRQ